MKAKEEINMSLIAKNINRIIREKGLKQKYVAEKVGVTESTFSNYLAERSGIKADMVPDFCRALEVEPNELYKQLNE